MVIWLTVGEGLAQPAGMPIQPEGNRHGLRRLREVVEVAGLEETEQSRWVSTGAGWTAVEVAAMHQLGDSHGTPASAFMCTDLTVRFPAREKESWAHFTVLKFLLCSARCATLSGIGCHLLRKTRRFRS